MTARRRMLWWRIVRALRVVALRLRLADAEEREHHRLDAYLADENVKAAAWRAHPFPELDHDPEARAIAIRLHRQIAGEWIVPQTEDEARSAALRAAVQSDDEPTTGGKA